MRAHLLVKCLLVGAVLSACNDANQPRTGALRVSVVTTGGDLDLNGYVATLDGGAPQPIPLNGSAVIADLPTGSHDIALADVAANCTLSGDNPRAARVSGGDTTDVAFVIGCVATGVRVTTRTTGIDLDADGYAVSIDGALAGVVGANATTEITRLAVGSHTVFLTARAPNCPMTGDSTRSVNLVLGDIATLIFDVSCRAVTGVIEVTAPTSGIDLDANGYTVQVDGGTARAIPVGGVLRFDRLNAGDHEVKLGGAAANCAIAGDTTRTLAVITGGTTRDTARTTFAVTCVAVSGVIEATVATSGVDLDADGYVVRVDSGLPQSLLANATTTFGGVSGGDHTVTLAGVAGNCTIDGANPRTVPVTVGGTTRDTARTTFAVTCVARIGNLKVTAATSGAELDSTGYTLLGDELCDYYYYGCYYGFSETVPSNGSVTIPGLPVGDHTVLLSAVAPNCTVAGDNPRTASVPPGGTVEMTFAVTCYARGALRIAVTTTGADLDPNGYTYVVSGPISTSGVVATNDTIAVPGLLAGNYQVSVGGVAANCSVAGGTTHAVAVPWADTAEVAFAVSCAAFGSLEVTAATTGGGLDPDGYAISATNPLSGTVTGNVATNGTVTFGALAPGDYLVTLSGVALNCSVNGANPRTITVPSGATATSTFDVACVTPGSIEVTTSTTGVDLDPTGYLATGAGPEASVPTNGTVTISGLRPGDYQITLSGASMNCDIAGPNPRVVSVPSGGTVVVTFDVSCAAATLLAIVTTGDIYSIKSNGADLIQLTTNTAADINPVWSPSGAKIAFTSYDSAQQSQIYVMDANGANRTRLTTVAGGNERPTWSPDGTKIAFVSWRTGNPDIYVMDANGANQVNRTNNAAWDSDPAWSPDGTKIAFVSVRDGNYEIYVMDANGSNVTRLTATGDAEYQPDWSPDGSRLVVTRENCDYYYYYCTDVMVIVNANGSGATALSVSSSALDPAWSPDGQWIAFADNNRVWATRVDGTRVVEIRDNASQPAWRRP